MGRRYLDDWQVTERQPPHRMAAYLRMLGMSAVFMVLTLVVFTVYGVFAAALRTHVITRPRVVMTRRVFAGSFAGLAARLALTES